MEYILHREAIIYNASILKPRSCGRVQEGQRCECMHASHHNLCTPIFQLYKEDESDCTFGLVNALLEHSRESLPFEEVVQFAADQAASTKSAAVVVPTSSLDPEQLLITTLKEIISFCRNKTLIYGQQLFSPLLLCF